ncbi:MAG: ABC transporter permease [Gemmatimonadales bacterium]|nr:ABC transporter permease [Gemmatimonadota bacterium]MCL4212972.1 ABC transporter permease [Gemmatimonadales bacterium]
MKIPIIYNLRSLRQRPVSTLTTALGMALVVAVFIAMTALASGFRAALVSTGSPENVLVLRKGAQQEMNSGIGRQNASIIGGFPFVASGADGLPMLSPETFVVVPLDRRDQGGMANVVVRGVNQRAFEVRKGITITAGRVFNAGAREVVVGSAFAARFPNSNVGDVLRFAETDWTVVGQFSAGGSAFESEVWGENEQFMPVFRGQIFQSVTFRMKDPAAFDGIKQTLESDPRLTLDAFRERDFYANQSTMLATILNFIAVFIAGIMAIGAVFGAVNTMYAAVASRGPEIGVLLTLGFPPRSVLASFLIESVLIAAIGGAIGCLIALPINGLVTSTTNWASFSEVAFAFRITPPLLVNGMIFAVVMGAVGGFFPALHAARQEVADALRAG